MQYQNKTFTVPMGGSKEYRDNWNLIYGNKEESHHTGVIQDPILGKIEPTLVFGDNDIQSYRYRSTGKVDNACWLVYVTTTLEHLDNDSISVCVTANVEDAIQILIFKRYDSNTFDAKKDIPRITQVTANKAIELWNHI